MEWQGGAEALSKADDKAWAQPLGAAILAIRHIGLGGWQQQECLALENELGCWQSQGKLAEATNMLRWAAHADVKGRWSLTASERPG